MLRYCAAAAPALRGAAVWRRGASASSSAGASRAPHPDDRFVGLTGAQIVHEILREQKVEVVVGYP